MPTTQLQQQGVERLDSFLSILHEMKNKIVSIVFRKGIF